MQGSDGPLIVCPVSCTKHNAAEWSRAAGRPVHASLVAAAAARASQAVTDHSCSAALSGVCVVFEYSVLRLRCACTLTGHLFSAFDNLNEDGAKTDDELARLISDFWPSPDPAHRNALAALKLLRMLAELNDAATALICALPAARRTENEPAAQLACLSATHAVQPCSHEIQATTAPACPTAPRCGRRARAASTGRAAPRRGSGQC